MNKLICTLFLAATACAQILGPILFGVAPTTGCGGSSFANCKTISFDHTKVPNTDQINFPALISGTYAYLATVGNGGQVQNASGFDVVFTSDSGCASKLNWEVETWTAASGLVAYWVQVPTLSHTTDTQIYMCYGKASISTDQSNATGTWDANFLGVYHEYTLNDSTSAGRNMSCQNGCTPAFSAGQIYNGRNDNATQKDGTATVTNLPTGASITATIDAWVKLTNGSASSNMYIAGWGDTFGLTTPVGGQFALIWDSTAGICIWDSASTKCGATTLNSAFHHWVATSSGGAGTVQTYLDGVALTMGSTGQAFNVCSGGCTQYGHLAIPNFTGIAAGLDGTLDEVRISNIARSVDWIKTEYNNESVPSTFYSGL